MPERLANNVCGARSMDDFDHYLVSCTTVNDSTGRCWLRLRSVYLRLSFTPLLRAVRKTLTGPNYQQSVTTDKLSICGLRL